jgi:hypothetical protein
MSSVDVAAIEEAMKMANLDTLRGYNQHRYAEVHQYATTEYLSQRQALGYQVLGEPMWNKGESAWSASYSCPHRIPGVPSSPSHLLFFKGPFWPASFPEKTSQC